ncbi:MAG: GNAT family N-acetyltransferase [Anaerolineales bacterium]|jgi:GNAT superfamily N-acetyltransferase
MKLARRNYRSEDDYWRIRQFLRDVYLLNHRHEHSWQVYRFDYWRWHVNLNIVKDSLEEKIFLWEVESGQLAAVLNPEGGHDAVFQVHPTWRTSSLEAEMLETAEASLGRSTESGRRRLVVWAAREDAARRTLLSQRGYRTEDWPEYQRRRSLDGEFPTAAVPEGYTVRALGDADELPARSWLSWRAFHPDEPDENYEGWQWYRNIQRCPLYRQDLDIVAAAPDGTLAAFCTVWFDDVTRTGSFEPVGTAPEHQKLGLGKAVMAAGLRRLQQLGATLATVGSYGPAAHALYKSVGFLEYDLSDPWVKEF